MRQFRFTCMFVYATVAVLFSSCGSGTGGEKTATDTTIPNTDTTTASTTPAVVNTIITTPQNMMVVTHKVADYDKWIASYEAHDSMRLANKVHSYVIGRGVTDPNTILVAVKIDDVDKAKAFAKDASLKKAMQQGGVTGPPTIHFVKILFQDTATIATDLRSTSMFAVKDWATWEKVFEEHRKEGLDNGLAVRAYGHDIDDDHKVIVVTAVLDTAKAFAFWKSDQLKQRRAQAGAIGEPKRFMYRMTKRY